MKPDSACLLPTHLSIAILAGGLGTRLRPVVSEVPKVLAPVGGRPFLAWWLEELERQGARRVVLCTGHGAEQVAACFGARHGRIALDYSVETAPLGTGGALRHAWPRLTSDPVLVLNGDSWCGVDLGAFWRAHRAQAAAVSLVLTRVADTRRFGRVVTGPGDRVLAFAEKAAADGPGWINAGIYLLGRRGLAAVPAGRPQSLERDLLPRWIEAGVHGFLCAGPFLDIGTPESYGQAEGFLAGLTRLAA